MQFLPFYCASSSWPFSVIWTKRLNGMGVISVHFLEYSLGEFDALRHQAVLAMYPKAYAALPLKWRDKCVPTLAELEATSLLGNGARWPCYGVQQFRNRLCDLQSLRSWQSIPGLHVGFVDKVN